MWWAGSAPLANGGIGASAARRAPGEHARAARRADDPLGRVLSRAHALVLVVPGGHAAALRDAAACGDRRSRALHLRPAAPSDPRSASSSRARRRSSSSTRWAASTSARSARRPPSRPCTRTFAAGCLTALGLPLTTDDERLVARCGRASGVRRGGALRRCFERASGIGRSGSHREAGVPLVAELQAFAARVDVVGKGQKQR